MATLTVWKFDSAGGAADALGQLERMQKEELIQIDDGAYVYWPEGKKKPKTEQLHYMAGGGALGGGFWGLLFGLIFFVPLLGLAVGAAMGALAGSMTDVGIDDEFIREVRRPGHPGHLGAVRDDRERRHRQGHRASSRTAAPRWCPPTCPRSRKRSCARPSPTRHPRDGPGRVEATGLGPPGSAPPPHPPGARSVPPLSATVTITPVALSRSWRPPLDERTPMTETSTAMRRPSLPVRSATGRARRIARGKAARAEVPRESHAEFLPGPAGPTRSPCWRARGSPGYRSCCPSGTGGWPRRPSPSSAARRCRWPATWRTRPRSGLTVQACGDAHLANFGLFASPERHLVFDINDFDETLPGPWEWDVKRLAASLEIAARGRTATRRRTAHAIVRRGRRGVPASDAGVRRDGPRLDVWYAHADVDRIQASRRRVPARRASARRSRAPWPRRRRRTTSGALSRFAAVARRRGRGSTPSRRSSSRCATCSTDAGAGRADRERGCAI